MRNYTQDELIAAALEEEERNKDELQKWLRREEEKRELRTKLKSKGNLTSPLPLKE